MTAFMYITFTEIFFIITTTVFFIGLYHIMSNRHSIIVLLASFEVLYLCSIINFVYSSYLWNSIDGIVATLIIIVAAGTEACIGIAIATAYRSLTDEFSLSSMFFTKN